MCCKNKDFLLFMTFLESIDTLVQAGHVYIVFIRNGSGCRGRCLPSGNRWMEECRIWDGCPG